MDMKDALSPGFMGRPRWGHNVGRREPEPGGVGLPWGWVGGWRRMPVHLALESVHCPARG
jgi:hypothetical protein